MIDMGKPDREKEALSTSAPRFKVRGRYNFSDFVDGITLSVVAILVAVILMMYLTDVSFRSDFSIKEFGFAAAVMYACTVSIYILLRSFSGRRGKRTKDYIDVCAAIENNANTIIEKGYARYASNYCRNWEKEELDNAREQVLCEVGISVNEYNATFCKYSKKEIERRYPHLSEAQKKAIETARKIKRLKYNERYLSVSEAHGRRRSPSGGFTVAWENRIKYAQIIITSAISSVFSATIAFEIISDPTFATVVACLVKIVIVLGFGAWGMIGGYNMTAVKEVAEKKERVAEQNRFIKWGDEHITVLSAEEKAREEKHAQDAATAHNAVADDVAPAPDDSTASVFSAVPIPVNT